MAKQINFRRFSAAKTLAAGFADEFTKKERRKQV